MSQETKRIIMKQVALEEISEIAQKAIKDEPYLSNALERIAEITHKVRQGIYTRGPRL